MNKPAFLLPARFLPTNRFLTSVLLALTWATGQPANAQDNVIEIKRDYYLRELKNKDLQEREIIANYDSILKLCLQLHDSTASARFLLEKGRFLSQSAQHLDAYSVFNSALAMLHALPEDSLNLLYQRQTLLAMAKESRRLGLFEESARQCFSLLSISKGKDKQSELMAYSILSLVYMVMGNERDAGLFQSEADALYARISGIGIEAYATYWNCKAGMMAIGGNVNLSISYLNETLSYLDSCQYAGEQYLFLTNNLANAYYSVKEFELALNYYERVSQKLQGLPVSWYKADNVFNLGRVHAALGNEADAEAQYRECLKMASAIDADDIRSFACLGLSDLLFSQGKDRESRILLDSGFRLLNRVSASQNAINLNILKNNYETESLRKSLSDCRLSYSNLETAQKAWKTVALCMIAISACFFVLLALTYRKYRSLLAKQKALQEKLSDLKKEKDSELEDAKRQYGLQIDAKEEQISILCQIMVKSRTMLDQLSDEVEALENGNPVLKKTDLGKLKAKLDTYKADDYWQFFDTYLHHQYCDFHKRLTQDYPDLTKNDVRFCMLMAIGMNTKDIALFTNRAVRTIESQIYRLRKKMKVAGNTKLGEFLSSYME